MSIAKGLILLIFLTMFYVIFVLKKENFKQKDFFLKTLSHDFRVATLAQLRGIEILSKLNNFDSRQKELIKEVENSCRYSLDMISMLMNSYMFEKGEKIVNYEYFGLKEITKDISLSFTEQTLDKNIELFLDIDHLLNINADKNLIIKLISNILSTAINYAEENSTIIITSRLLNNSLEFSIAYQGKALSEEECERMFSKKTHFSTVGHGIKMYFSKKIVDFHNGKIWVKNYSKNLNSFTFCIPQKKNINSLKLSIISRFQTN